MKYLPRCAKVNVAGMFSLRDKITIVWDPHSASGGFDGVPFHAGGGNCTLKLRPTVIRWFYAENEEKYKERQNFFEE